MSRRALQTAVLHASRFGRQAGAVKSVSDLLVTTPVLQRSSWCQDALLLPHRGAVTGITHTSKWMQGKDKPSPMELINSVPPIQIEGRIVACEGGVNAAIGHPVEYINLDGPEPAVCKYCGLRYEQVHKH